MIIIWLLREFFMPELADRFQREFERHLVSSSLKDFS